MHTLPVEQVKHLSLKFDQELRIELVFTAMLLHLVVQSHDAFHLICFDDVAVFTEILVAKIDKASLLERLFRVQRAALDIRMKQVDHILHMHKVQPPLP